MPPPQILIRILMSAGAVVAKSFFDAYTAHAQQAAQLGVTGESMGPAPMTREEACRILAVPTPPVGKSISPELLQQAEENFLRMFKANQPREKGEPGEGSEYVQAKLFFAHRYLQNGERKEDE
eukprot:TRINITY_DN89546_c0_g1_i1.p1 TRINITY_DN89546_c0_g1~~TRINITY_DN89546_c0_g1_i1.p1  ORF type:complete len:123 (-),score=19.68 TRINITY_DN89546_c0_g1_i1:72-440(-)